MWKKVLFVLIVGLLPSCTDPVLLSTVKITNLDNTSGGSGTIIRSEKTYSEVLTNAHVCHVTDNGGMVTSLYQRAFVLSYKISEQHDLCLIKTSESFNVNTDIASSEPNILDYARASGHPQLLPIIVSEGHFSGKELVPVMIGLRKCTEAEFNDPIFGKFCIFAGGIPIVKIYETVVVSTLIQPGSSGSAIYNSSGKIAAVVFAGSRDIGYAMAVPFNYVYNFINNEVPILKETVVNLTVDVTGQGKSSPDKKEDKVLNLLEEACENSDTMTPQQVKFCNDFLGSRDIDDETI